MENSNSEKNASPQDRFISLVQKVIKHMTATGPYKTQDVQQKIEQIQQMIHQVHRPPINVSAVISRGSIPMSRYSMPCMASLLYQTSLQRQVPEEKRSDATRLFHILLDAINPADINNRSMHYHSMLFDAINYDAPMEIIDTLLQRGADIYTKDENGKTPFLHAASIGRMDVLQTLLERGTDINQVDHAGKTALMYAANHGRIPVAEFLLANGAAIDLQNNAGETALLIASRWLDNQPMVRLLLERGAEPHLTNKEGHNTWNYANESMLNLLRPYFPGRRHNNNNNMEGGRRRSKTRRHRRRATIRRSKTHRRRR